MRESLGGSLLPEWLGQRARLTPTGPALISGESTWTFQQLNARAEAFAQKLAAVLTPGSAPGVAPGAVPGGSLAAAPGAEASAGGEHGGANFSAPLIGPRVAVLMENSPAFVVAVHGVAKSNAVLVPLNTRLAPQELAYQVADAGAAVLVHDAAYGPLAEAVAGLAGGIRRMRWDGPLDGPPDLFHYGAPGVVSLERTHSIVYTSGTTGKPKGAMLTYGNYWWNAIGSALHLGVTEADRWLAAMPLFHVGGLSILLRSVVYGIPVILHKTFDPDAVNRAIDEEGATLLSVVAVMLQRMLAARGGRPYPSTVRAVLVGGGPAPASLLAEARTLGLPAVATYGLTETASQVATMVPGDGGARPGASGKPLFPVRVRILPVQDVADGRGTDGLPPGDVGEIAVAGPTVSPGYWGAGDWTSAGDMRRPEAPSSEDRLGSNATERWFRTGDLGFFDEEGYLYVVDRRDDMFVSGGENVYPAEIEEVLAAHPAVEEAAVVGVPDGTWGRVPGAAIVKKPGHSLDADGVRDYCRARLAGYKVPRPVVFVGRLPRNAAGKLLRRQIQKLFGSEP